MSSETRTSLRAFWVVLLVLTAALAWLVRDGLRPDTNLLSLLPQAERDPVLAEIVDRFTRTLSSKTVFLVSAPEPEQAEQAAADLVDALERSEWFARVSGQMEDTGKGAFELYFPYRYQLLAPELRHALAADGDGAATALLGRATESIYNPTSSLFSRILDRDPLLLFPQFLEGLPRPPGDLKVRNGYLSVAGEGRYSILITADATGESFARAQQKQTSAFLEQLSADLHARYPKLELDTTGMLLYAAAGSEAAEGEISTIGLGSLLGVVLLFLIVFRGTRPLLLGILPLVVGLLTALVATLAVFGRIHALTLGFGASMIGICIDYTFHYFCELSAAPAAGPRAALKHILPAITLGALTSVLGYLGLFVAPFPGLRQMALFSSAGLVGAFATVVMVFPYWSGQSKPAHDFATRAAAWYLTFWRNLPARLLWLAALPLALFLAIGLSRLQGDDDIRRLQTPAAELLRQEQRIRAAVGQVDTSRFLLVEGASVEQVLERQEALFDDLRVLQSEGRLSFFQGVATMVPSSARQRDNHALLAKTLGQPPARLNEYFESLGFDDEVRRAAETALSQRPSDYLGLEDWLASPASAPMRHLWLGETARGQAAVVVLGGLDPTFDLAAWAAQRQGLTFVDRVAAISKLMQRYRLLGAELVALSYLVILLLLVFRYGLRGGLLAVLPPLLAAAVTLALFGWLGHPMNLFHVLALLLVLGVGIDYAIFFAEVGGARPSTMLAVLLSATTTLLSFGLLALSATPVLQAFGLTVLFGIGAAWLLSPLAARNSVERGSGEVGVGAP